ncbi:MAG: acyl-CoA dehydrogenase, partial [Anaerolineae bacterium]|nr:acyl-CoA dehydrogenase [Anaerolineae bacterium]
VQGVGIAGAATVKALNHALERPQGGAPDKPAVAIIKHADVRRMLFSMQARVEAMRAVMLETALQLDLSRMAPDPQAREVAAQQAQFMLPLCKAFFSDTGFEVANLAVQVLGGYGYISDAGVEQYVRDIRVASIYEGSNGIQAFDLVTRKLLADSGQAAWEFVRRVRMDLQQYRDNESTRVIRDALTDAVARLERVMETYLSLVKDQRRDAETGASAYLQLLGRVASGWMWLRMSAIAQNDTPLHRRKRALAEFYACYLMPEVAALEQQALVQAEWIDVLEDELLARS